MKQKLRIKVSKTKEEGSFNLRRLFVRERILKFLLGNPSELTVLVPGKEISEISISTDEKGEDDARKRITV